MYNNVGSKVKILAKAVCLLGIIASVVYGLVLIAPGTENNTVLGILIIPLGSLLFWLGSLPIYAIGEAAENAERFGCK